MTITPVPEVRRDPDTGAIAQRIPDGHQVNEMEWVTVWFNPDHADALRIELTPDSYVDGWTVLWCEQSDQPKEK